MADRVPLDFDPAVRQLRALLLGITDDRLGRATPCPQWSVGDLLDHIVALSWAFTQAARKLSDAPGVDGPPPRPSAANLPPHWRSRLPVLLEELATAWKEPSAWTGTASAGGVTLPAAEMGLVAMNELTMHGWDLAMGSGQEYAADPRILEALIEFLSRDATPRATVDGGASPLDQALVLAGRDPRWRQNRRDVSARSTSAVE